MEEAPTPENQAKTKTDYTIISDKNHSFSISIIKTTSYIQILGSFQDDLLNHIYKTELSLEDLKKSNKYFLLYETIDEIYADLLLFMNKNQTKLSEDNGSIKINIPLESLKIKEISFNLKEQMKNDKEIVQELISLVSELKKEVKEIREENKELKTKINILESYIPLLEEYKKEKEEEKEKAKIQNLDSLIIKDNINYNKTLKNWINPNVKIKAQLLYRASRDGEDYQTFHRLCDNQGSTLVLTKLSEGDILGTYTPISWESSGGWKDYSNIFVFSLTRNLKAEKKKTNNNYGIYRHKDHGPESFFLCFKPGKKMKEPKLRIDNSEYLIDTQTLVPDRKNGNYYKADEVEIFKIIFT